MFLTVHNFDYNGAKSKVSLIQNMNSLGTDCSRKGFIFGKRVSGSFQIFVGCSPFPP